MVNIFVVTGLSRDRCVTGLGPSLKNLGESYKVICYVMAIFLVCYMHAYMHAYMHVTACIN